MKVLLINPKYFNKRGNHWIPIGLASIASNLIKNSIKVKILDNAVFDLSDNNIKKIITNFNPDIVGTGGMTAQFNDAIRIGKLVKTTLPNTTLVYGGVHFTFKPEDSIGDAVVIGEGEKAFLDICNGAKGIIEKPLTDNLDEYPIPAYHLLHLDMYGDRLITGERAISMMTSRGCPFNCVFCAAPNIYKRKLRYNSINYIEKHIFYLVSRYNVKAITIQDSTFASDKNRVFDFCDMIEKNQFKQLKMGCLTSVKTADYEMFKRMKEVGFTVVSFGIESANENIQKLINKNLTKSQIKSAVEMAKRAEIDTELLFMVGNIGETKSTIQESIDFSHELKQLDKIYGTKSHIYFQFAAPFVGSKFYDVAQDYGEIVETNYDNYNHRVPIFIPNGLDKDTMMQMMDSIGPTQPPPYAEERFYSLNRCLFGEYNGTIVSAQLKNIKEKMFGTRRLFPV